jgi:hypothetical protein
MLKAKKKINKNLEVYVFDTKSGFQHESQGAVIIKGLTEKGFYLDNTDRPCLALTDKTAKDLIEFLNVSLKKKAKR